MLRCLTGGPRACLQSGVPAAADTSARAVPGRLVRAAAGLRSPPSWCLCASLTPVFQARKWELPQPFILLTKFFVFSTEFLAQSPYMYTHMQAHLCTLTHRCTHTDFPRRSPLPCGSEWMGISCGLRSGLCVLSCAGSSLLCTGFLQLRPAGTALERPRSAFSRHGFSCCGSWALGAQASVVVAHELSCSVARGIFLDQGSNRVPCIFRHSQPLDCQGSPAAGSLEQHDQYTARFPRHSCTVPSPIPSV